MTEMGQNRFKNNEDNQPRVENSLNYLAEQQKLIYDKKSNIKENDYLAHKNASYNNEGYTMSQAPRSNIQEDKIAYDNRNYYPSILQKNYEMPPQAQIYKSIPRESNQYESLPQGRRNQNSVNLSFDQPTQNPINKMMLGKDQSLNRESDILSKLVISEDPYANLKNNNVGNNNIGPKIPKKNETIEEKEEEINQKGNPIKKQHRFPFDDFEMLKRKFAGIRRNSTPLDEIKAIREKNYENPNHGKNQRPIINLKDALQCRIISSADIGRKERLKRLLIGDNIIN